MSAVLNLKEETERLRRRVERAEAEAATIRAKMNPPAAMRDELSAIQSRYDSVALMFGDNCSLPHIMAPIPGETPLMYRQRRLKDFTKYSPGCKNVAVERLGEDSISVVEAQVMKDAQAASYDPASYPPGTINPVKYKDEAGRECTRWVGSGWFGDAFSLQGAGGHVRDPGDQARFANPNPRRRR
jgi:hypothetical protein